MTHTNSVRRDRVEAELVRRALLDADGNDWLVRAFVDCAGRETLGFAGAGRTPIGEQVELVLGVRDNAAETMQLAKERLELAGFEAFHPGGRSLFVRNKPSEASLLSLAYGPWSPAYYERRGRAA